jgi:hypothetical protein
MARSARVAPDLDPWDAIHDRSTPMLLEQAPAPEAPWVADLLAQAPFTWRVEGPAEMVAGLLTIAPTALQEMVAAHARRFAHLMAAPNLSVRVEGITGNACTRVHADYTDVRLIQTLAGPGTDYAPDGDPEAPLARVPTGWIGLFKGRSYPGADNCCHQPCLHRSPPIAGTGERRLVLVIDTVEG